MSLSNFKKCIGFRVSFAISIYYSDILVFLLITGPMVWYQQIEYATGHWLQKATEHVFGCVMCCPGAFSLFRASAIMDDNVMRMYATPPSEAKHYIQFEQGNTFYCGFSIYFTVIELILLNVVQQYFSYIHYRHRFTNNTCSM